MHNYTIMLFDQMFLMRILINSAWLDILSSWVEENINSKKKNLVISVPFTFHFIDKNSFYIGYLFIV